jgi:alpha-tubulin suppressor-like RCC1 family protein
MSLRASLRLFAVAVGSAGLLFTAGAARATPTTRAVAWAACGGACNVPSDLVGVTGVAAGSDFSLALRGDGTVVAWGCGFHYGHCSVPNGLTGVTAIVAGHFHSLALKGDGTVVAWGCGGGFDYGQCSVPGGLSGVIAVSAGVSHSLALRGCTQ